MRPYQAHVLDRALTAFLQEGDTALAVRLGPGRETVRVLSERFAVG